ncbi:MAG: type IX secretion system membrane protein PorP/SprF [Bacteroidales bacterium]|nr:type IX secretion system membrane protein PorP/SprF [Bacteroidales bacterium]
MKISHIKKTLIVTVVLISVNAKAQQFPIYSQYMMNGFLLNPAVAGHEGYTSVNLTVREQWLGLKDAPSTYALSGQTRLLKNSYISRSRSVKKRDRAMSRSGRVGFGGYIFKDSNGALSRTGISGAYGYHLTLRRSQLSLGASLSTFQYKIDKAELNVEDENDRLLLETDSKAFITDANFGAYYSDRNIYAGFSIQNIFESLLKLNNREGAGFKLERHYLLMAGYRYDLIDFLFIEPSFLLKISEKSFTQLDTNIKFYFKEDYWGGISYRTGSGSRVAQESISGRGSSLIIMAGARVDKYYFGYAFDYTFSSISSKTIGSHELMLAVKFGDSARRYRWLNRY